MRSGNGQLFVRSTDGSTPEEALHLADLEEAPTDWSPDGRFLAFDQFNPSVGGTNIWILPMSGEHRPWPFLQSKFNESDSHFSPDGRWLAYVSEQTGQPEVYVTSFPKPGVKTQISAKGGAEPRWRGDGKELYYVSADREMVAAELRMSIEPTVVRTTPLFKLPGPTFSIQNPWPYDVTADGSRFLIGVPLEERTTPPIHVVVNWRAPLQQR
jgi:Tol biopolymer transport system component